VEEVVGALAILLLKTDPDLAAELALDLANPLDALRNVIDLDAGTGKLAEMVQDRAGKLVDQIDNGLDVLDDAKDSAKDQANDAVDVTKDAADKAQDEVKGLF
jgi:predicted RNA methylase